MRKLARLLAWLALAAAAAFLALQLSFLARIWWWKDHNPGSTAFIVLAAADDPRVLVPTALGVGWSVNFGALAARSMR